MSLINIINENKKYDKQFSMLYKKLPMKVNNDFTLTKEFIKSIQKEWIDAEPDKETLKVFNERLYNWITYFIDVNTNGGKLYRIISVNHELEIKLNKEELGQHWTNYKGLEDINEYLGTEFGIPTFGDYIAIIVIDTPPNNISIVDVNFVDWSNEQEYTIVDLSKISIKKVLLARGINGDYKNLDLKKYGIN